MGKKSKGYLFLLPSIIIMLFLGVYPVIEAIWTSLNKYKLTDPSAGKIFIFLDNYIYMLKDTRFWMALLRSMQFVIVSVSVSFIIGVGIALLLHKVRWSKGFFRIVFLVPMVTAPAITSLNFKFMYNYNLGIFNHILEKLSLGRVNFLGNTSMVLWSIILVDIWQWTPLIILVLLAGLESLPKEPYEAAMLDGANWLQIFRFITIPLLTRFITITLIIRIMDVLKIYETIYLITQGGPGAASETLNIYVARVGFNWYEMGYASTLGIFILYFTMFFCWFLVKRTKAFEVVAR